jgi:iron complex outermembrane receptor protein
MDVTGLRRLHRTITSILLLTAAGAAASPAWAEGPVVSVNIPAGNAEETLIEFARQSKVQPFYPTRIVRGVRTNAIAGEFEASEALARMLEGTRLTFEFNPANPWNVTLHAPASSKRSAARRSADEGPVDERPRLAALFERMHVPNDQSLEEVTVTGTMIRGLDAITAPLVFLEQQDVKKSGRATVQDVVHALPFVSLAGPREDVGGETNYNRGASINLRGLGPGATLVLVNGRRQPGSGVFGDFVDVSNIPWTAVEKIEVMPDGASALYGADAIGGVVNIILRKDLDGAETRTRLSTSGGGADETVLAHLYARDWNSGTLLLAYQFADRAALPISARDYAADADKTPFGGSDLSDFHSSPGNILDPMTLQPVFGIPQNQAGKKLTPADLLSDVNLHNPNRGADLMPDMRSHSGYLTVSQNLTDSLKLLAEGRFNVRDIEQEVVSLFQILTVPSTNAFFVDPFEGDSPATLVAYNFFGDLGTRHAVGETRTATGSVGLEFEFGKDWQATLTTSYGRERMKWVVDDAIDPALLNVALASGDVNSAFNPFGAGSLANRKVLEAITTTQDEWAQSSLSETTLVADGPVFELPAGDLKLAVGFSYREERLSREASLGSLISPRADYGREIAALFAEIAIPLAARVDVSLAGRFEEYSDFGSTFNPKLGVRWTLSDQLRFRGSWGTSFRAPALVDMDEQRLSSVAMMPLADPLSPTGQSMALVRFGKNAGLHEETATTWTVGFDFAPARFEDSSLSLTYFSVDYANRILQPGPLLKPLDILLEESLWSDVITRNPSQHVVNEICSAPYFFGDVDACAATPPTLVVDLRLHNLAATRVNGLDVEFQKRLNTSVGEWNFRTQGTYLMRFAQALSPGSPAADVENTAGNPVGLRLRTVVDWYETGANREGWAISAAVNHKGGYVDGFSEMGRGVDPWTTVDLHLRYRTSRGPALLNDVELALGAVNLFDRDPPFLNTLVGYDTANAEPLGRVINFYIQKNW